ncbi:hypothetical protein BJ875DRAFT_167611 [Amylocarpus encephaloides]|uniref:Nudix hydrolase domain-containing protein n=1 Tax=Amylocarpus encephaloides TaxID=45428 RepID=A0A9P8C142_9HELO|nr:hypothetical protein BJ875DRAFT_167611 [Amylocarpus encephaloides]
MTEANLRLKEWLDDLCVRFIINLPEEDLQDIARICFQVEEAQWFYEDFIRPLDPALPTMSLRTFCLRIFAHCPLLSPFSTGHHMRAFENFMEYKTRIPVRGVIMLNENMDSVVLVKGWKKGASWSFPRGKIAKDEEDLTCAVREAYEETGLDMDAAGMVPPNRDVQSIEVNMREQNMQLFVFRDIPMDTPFAPRTRKEISKIQWWPLSDLPAFRKKGPQPQSEATPAINPSKFYMVAPFLPQIRRYVIEQKKKDAKKTAGNHHLSANMIHDDLMTEEDQGAESAAQASTQERRPAPELDTLEGATAALSRLLKIQPATQGLQPEVANHASITKNSGSALLALLHNKPLPHVDDQPLPSNIPPHTPMENISANPSMPKTPHHQPPRPQPLSRLPPPPTFPIQSLDGSFSYRDQTPQNSHQRNHMVPIPDHTLSHQNLSRPQETPHHYQPQHLIHPQPLPPHVQKAVFTGGPVYSPMMPPPIQQLRHPQVSSTVSMTVNNPQFPGLHAPMVPPTIDQGPKLTSHSLALLNAFKSRDRAGEASSTSGLPLRDHREPIISRVVPQELPAMEAQNRIPTHIPPPITVQPSLEILEKSAMTPRQPISASQKSTLLGMFKSPTTPMASIARAPAATALPVNGTPSAVELSAVEPLTTTPSTSLPSLGGKKTLGMLPAEQTPVLNPEASLPYRAISILSRPQEKSSEPEQKISPESISRARTNGKKPMSRGGGNSQGQAHQSPNTFQPQILKRPISGSLRTAPSPTSIPSKSTVAPHAPMEPGFTQTSDQKQSLLSLFNQAYLPVGVPPTRDGPSQMGPPLKAPVRSRVGSLASGEGSSSRRGSQTPISPADKGFLLSYLDAVANGTQR